MANRVVHFVAAYVLLSASVSPLVAQTDPGTEALGAAIERAISDLGLGGGARSGILIDTLRSVIDSRTADQLVRELGVSLGVSEAHCRRFLMSEERPELRAPFGYRVHGVDAILTIGRGDFATDSAHVWITTARGSGQYVGGPRSYIVRRGSGRWLAEPHMMMSPHGSCHPQLFTAPLVLAAQTLLADLRAAGPICLDPTGFLLHERDSVALLLGAEIRGQWVPKIGGETPELARDLCERAPVQWGSVVRFLRVDWEADDLLHVTVEGRIPAEHTGRRIQYTLRQTGAEWTVTYRAEITGHLLPDCFGSDSRCGVVTIRTARGAR
jgi:hypothetical protein